MKICKKGTWNERMCAEPALSLVAVICGLKRIRHRLAVYIQMRLVYKQVKQKYDTTIWMRLNYINKFEGEGAVLNWKEIALSELKAELPSTEFNHQ
jgi:hypothetical protein